MNEIDQVVGRIAKNACPPCVPVQRAAGSAGEMNFGVTSVAAPKAALSSTAKYSSIARLDISGAKKSHKRGESPLIG